MSDILIRHCTIRIVRTGGWAWGKEPRALLGRALDRLPALIAEEMERLWPGDAEREISAPVRMRMPISLAELRAGSDLASGNGSPASAPARDLSKRTRAALRQAFAAEIDASAEEQSVPDEAIEALRPDTRPLRGDAPPTEPLAVLVNWLRDGRVQARLRSFTLDTLSAWHAYIVATPIARPDDPTAIAQLAERLAERLMARPPGSADDISETLQLRLQTFAALEAMMRGCLQSAVLRDTIERLLPCPVFRLAAPHPVRVAPTPIEAAGAVGPEPAPSSATSAPRPGPPRAHVSSRAVPLERRIDCALPFLVLGPLARIGYFDAAAAVFAVAGATEALPLFAAALAYKVMDPPARAWLRLPPVRAAAAACALLPEPPEDGDIAALAHALSLQLSPLDGVVEDILLEGHRPGTPLLVTRASGAPDGCLALWDVDGLFPIALTPDPAPVLRRILEEFVLIPAEAAAPALLSGFDAADIRFITDAPPCRGEHWRRVAGRRGERWWSNDALSAEAHLAAAGRRLPEVAELAEASWQALGVDRPSVPRHAGDAFDRSLTLAAGLALGSIAWDLWRGREPTAPPLALARFRDLDGLVRVDGKRVSVLLPLGRRFFDLRDHGFLDDVHEIPWFGGRVLCFSSG
jgi:hypothetical protein